MQYGYERRMEAEGHDRFCRLYYAHSTYRGEALPSKVKLEMLSL